MRIADAGPRTWLLAAFAAWALCAWLLALFGMGGGIRRLEEDPALRQPLPDVFRPGPERLGPLAQYPEASRRPMFTEDRRPQPYLVDPTAGQAAGNDFDFVLTGVLRTPTLQMAILQPAGGGRSLGVKVGESPQGVPRWTLASVGSRSAVFNGPDGERTLQLRQFDGTGGEPPTPSAATAPSPGRPSRASGPAGAPPVEVAVDDEGMPVQAAPAEAQPASGAQADGQGGGNGEAARVSQEQLEAIRRRIEERRARLRQQALQDQQGNRTP